jgi:hypothetical protein
MRMLEDKNAEIGQMGEQLSVAHKLQDDQKRKIAEQTHTIERMQAEIAQMKMAHEEKLAEKDKFWQDKVEDLILFI